MGGGRCGGGGGGLVGQGGLCIAHVVTDSQMTSHDLPPTAGFSFSDHSFLVAEINFGISGMEGV